MKQLHPDCTPGKNELLVDLRSVSRTTELPAKIQRAALPASGPQGDTNPLTAEGRKNSPKHPRSQIRVRSGKWCWVRRGPKEPSRGRDWSSSG